jgi:hypothetical protein
MIIKALWNSIKIFLNKNTIRKVEFLGKKDLHVLGDYIDLSILPTKYGGYLDRYDFE